MWKYTVDVDGMRCSMCEAHTNDAVRKAFAVKKVTSSHSDKKTVILAPEALDEQKLRDTITNLGYDVGEIRKEEAKKGLFGWK